MNHTAKTFANVCAVISAELNCAVGDLTPATTAEDVNGWDSLAHARLIMSLEAHLNIRFPSDRLFDLDCVGELADLAEEAKLNGDSPHALT